MKTGSGGKGMKFMVIKFTTFIALKGFDGGVELCLNKFVKDFILSNVSDLNLRGKTNV